VLKNYLKEKYIKYGIEEYFKTDFEYLEASINDINGFWDKNINEIDKIKLIILAEAPMWGKNEKYFYNPETIHSQFFYQSDLEYVIGEPIGNKQELISKLNETGTIILDFSPFPFNPEKTMLSYKRDKKGISKRITRKDYQDILRETFPIHLKARLEKIKKKSCEIENVQICYRYSRVKSNLNEILQSLFLKLDFNMISNANSISMIGGGIDKEKLKNEIAQANN